VISIPSDAATATKLPPQAPQGLVTSFLAERPAGGPARWQAYGHPGDLSLKALGYQAAAHVSRGATTQQSANVRARQDEFDTAREEYVEFGRAVPERGDFGRHESPHFRANELNQGDYGFYLMAELTLERLEALRALVADWFAKDTLEFSGLPLTSGYRNPVHHQFHNLEDRAKPRLNNSVHQYGGAVDIDIFGQPLSETDFFSLLKQFAKDSTVGACFEPDSAIIRDNGELDHAHLEWRPTCPTGW
jgi:hypothetical protein